MSAIKPGALRAARVRSGRTQDDVALEAGVSRRRYQSIERGENTSVDSLRAICQTLGVKGADVIDF